MGPKEAKEEEEEEAGHFEGIRTGSKEAWLKHKARLHPVQYKKTLSLLSVYKPKEGGLHNQSCLL